MSSRFPEIHSPSSRAKDGFNLSLTGIDDLFYDNLTNPSEELAKLQDLFDEGRYKRYLLALYNNGLNNRAKFRAFANETVGIDGPTADEVFSCAADSFRKDVTGSLADAVMTKEQFAVGIIRLANLWSLMNDGMVDTSHLTDQSTSFLDTIMGSA